MIENSRIHTDFGLGVFVARNPQELVTAGIHAGLKQLAGSPATGPLPYPRADRRFLRPPWRVKCADVGRETGPTGPGSRPTGAAHIHIFRDQGENAGPGVLRPGYHTLGAETGFVTTTSSPEGSIR
jgi:hypothetical protein